jgi:acyl-CoA synthetase (AMP-forming)/AMP-acid ligase II/acyl carrier protein
MTLQLDQKIREAVIHGPPRKLVDGAPAAAMENIALRVAEAPDGLIRSYQPDGTLREETFAEVWQRSSEIAVRLRSLGVGPGSQAVLLLSDLLDFVACFWASVRIGASAIPFTGVAHNAAAEQLKNLVARLERPALVADASSPDLDRLAALLPDAPILRVSSLSADGDPSGKEELDPGDEPDIICLLPTSGSTGSVKLVMLDRRAILYRNFSENYSVGHLSARILNVFPFEGISGMRALYPTYTSLTQLHPRILTARPLAIFEAIERFAITHAYMTNSMAARLIEDAPKEGRVFDLSSLKMVGLGGETVTRFVATRFDALLNRHGAANVLRAGYGATETSSLLVGADPSACPLDDAGAPILGGPAAGISLRIVHEQGFTLYEGEAGHVEAFAPQTLFAGYWKEPELTRDCMTADGWYKTGDLGAINEAGFSFRGRAKQLLVIGGRKFSLDDIDACLQGDAGIGRQTVAFVARVSSDATDGLGVAVAVADGESLDNGATDRIRHVLVRRYGFAPAVVMPVRPGDLPLTATGKVDRRALAERAAKAGETSRGETPSSWPSPPESDEEATLASLWREALNLATDFGRDDNFFDCGGDSLRASTLLMGVEKRFKRQIALREFFEVPTFNNLVRLVQSASASPAGDQEKRLWPLPYEISRGILSYVEAWSGERVTEDRLMLGANRGGALPPLFCVVQEDYEFQYLATALGPQQPVYAFRSLFHVSDDYAEDQIQALALRYVKDIQQAHPDGPLFLLAYCQACRIAIPMAQHLLRRRRHLPLLILVDWTTEPLSYPGEALLLFGRDSPFNPKFASFNPEPAWRRMFGDFSCAVVDGDHDDDTLFQPNPVSLAGEVAQRCAQALDRTRKFSPLEDCAFEFTVAKAPGRARPGARLRFEVSLKNVGTAPIGGEHSNLRVGGFWTRDGEIDGPRFIEATPLPEIAPGAVSVEEVMVPAPENDGKFELALDLFEERGHSLTGLGAAPTGARVKVRRISTRIRNIVGHPFSPGRGVQPR